MNPRRSLLFVPANRPDRFAKAVASGADMICLDLEDSVPASDKAAARSHVASYLSSHTGDTELVVRINSLRLREGLRDLLLLAEHPASRWILCLAKVESAGELALARSALMEGGHSAALLPLIESLSGLQRVREIVRAPGVSLVGLGTADVAADLFTSMDWEPMLLARQQVVYESRAAGIGAMDGAWPSLDDMEGLALETRRAAALGFMTKPCLHPRQVAVVHESLRPSSAEIARAREIVDAFDRAGGAAVKLNGRLIDRPIAESARRKIAIYDRDRSTI